MGMQIENNNDFLDKHEAHGDRELKYYKDIYGNDVRLLTSKEKNFVNKGLVIASVFVVILLSGFFYKAYLVQKEIEERTKLYMISGQSLADGQDIVSEGGVILSEDTDVVDVEEDGTIVAKTSGTTNVTIYKNIDEHDFSNAKNNKEWADGEEISLYDAYTDLGIEGEITVEVTVKQAVTGVTINMPVLDVYIGETNKLIANVFPHTSYNKDTTWTSSNNSVATVDANGVITARSVGTTTITVTTKDGGFKDSTLVNVLKKESENSIYMALESKEFYIGDTKNVVTVVSPDETLLSDVVYSSSDSSVATIDTNGKIVAKKVGKTTITARIASENISSSIDIVVKSKTLENIYLSSESLSLVIGDKVTLQSYLYPNDASSFITYTSNDSNIVSVNSRGEITALKEGITTVYVKGNNNIIAKCIVEVDNDINKAKSVSITLEKDEISVGSKTKVTSSVKPENASNKNVTYVSSDSSVAVVDSEGNVIGKAPGNAVITVTNSNGVSDSVSIKVDETKIAIKDLSLPTNIKISAGKSTIINPVINPSNANDLDITWSSSNDDVAKVSSDGIVTGIKEGKVVITATIGDIKATTDVEVEAIAVTKIDLNMNDVKMFVSENISLKSTVYPANTTNANITWSSSDTKIAKVSSNGKITALKEGTVVIKATSSSNPNVYAECNVTVSKIGVESFKLSNKQILVTEGKTSKLAVSNINPSNATYTDISYRIEDNSIATVDSKGVITGIKPGKTTITVTIDDVSKTLDVTVFEEGDKVYFIDTYTSLETPSDAILLESNGKYAMIDTGSQTSSIEVIDFLHDLGVKRLEFVLITHFHSESFGGVYGEIGADNLLLSDIKIGKLYMKPYAASDSYFKDSTGKVITTSSKITERRNARSSMFTTIRENAILNDVSYVPIDSSVKELNLGDIKLHLYNTSERLKNYSSKCLKNYNCNENSNSIVTYAEVNDKTLYLAGDIYNAYHDADSKYLGSKTEITIADKITSDFDKKVDIYKASNYGDSGSNVKEALSKINPTYSIITNSSSYFDDTNNKGIERIDEYTSKNIYYSGDGTVILNINNKGNMSFVQLSD